jgi:DNA polymerase-3 subunit beta
VVDESYKVSIRAGYASFTISAEGADDYPDLPDVNTGRAIRIPQNKLKELISGTIFAVSENQGRPIHTGVKFEVTNTSITAIAVDGFRLARRSFHPEEETGRELSFVVPAAGLKEVEKILTDVDDDAAFTLGTKHILFQIGSATLVCRLLEGDFLDWRRVVPTNCPIKLVANVGELQSSVERVGLIVSEKYKSPVRCVFSNQVLNMRTNTTIGAAEDRCTLAGDGKELEIGFNVRYLADALRVIPSEEVTLELTNGLSPIVLTPAEDKYDFSYMVLPVRIKNN